MRARIAAHFAAWVLVSLLPALLHDDAPVPAPPPVLDATLRTHTFARAGAVGAGYYWISDSMWAMFQLTFAIITPALIIGAIAERMKFIAVTDQQDRPIGMLVEGKSDDMTFTLANAYFDGETRLIWAFSDWLARQDKTLPPEVIEKQLELSEEKLMVERNRAWIPVIEAASATSQDKPVLMAAGALHLAGEGGVLNLLAARGWAITPY